MFISSYHFSLGQTYAQNLQNRPSVLSTKEGSALDDDSYMGYSLTVGDFTGDGQSGVAIGMPRGNSGDQKLVGKVRGFTSNFSCQHFSTMCVGLDTILGKNP